jgi:hypothetical protein
MLFGRVREAAGVWRIERIGGRALALLGLLHAAVSGWGAVGLSARANTDTVATHTNTHAIA